MDLARFREKNYNTVNIKFNFRHSTQVHVFGTEQAQPNAVAITTNIGVNSTTTTSTSASTSQGNPCSTPSATANVPTGSPATGPTTPGHARLAVNLFSPDNVILKDDKLTDETKFDAWISEIGVNSA